jgi:hypothetical protein
VLCAAGGHGTLVNGATAGTIQLVWAQNTSSGTSTVIHTQSYVLLRRLG